MRETETHRDSEYRGYKHYSLEEKMRAAQRMYDEIIQDDELDFYSKTTYMFSAIEDMNHELAEHAVIGSPVLMSHGYIGDDRYSASWAEVNEPVVGTYRGLHLLLTPGKTLDTVAEIKVVHRIQAHRSPLAAKSVEPADTLYAYVELSDTENNLHVFEPQYTQLTNQRWMGQQILTLSELSGDVYGNIGKIFRDITQNRSRVPRQRRADGFVDIFNRLIQTVGQVVEIQTSLALIYENNPTPNKISHPSSEVFIVYGVSNGFIPLPRYRAATDGSRDLIPDFTATELAVSLTFAVGSHKTTIMNVPVSAIKELNALNRDELA